MTDILLDPLTGDLDLTTGLALTTSLPQEARQRIEQWIGINVGEWFANINAGLPYLKNPEESLPQNIRYFLGNKFPDTPRFIANTMTSSIRDMEFVKFVDSDYDFNPNTRVFTYSFKVTLNSGEDVSFPSFITTTL